MSTNVTRDAVFDALIEWAQADREAEIAADTLHALARVPSNPYAVIVDSEFRRHQEAFTKLSKQADDAEHKMRELSRAYIEQAVPR